MRALDHLRLAAKQFAQSAGRLAREVEVDELNQVIVAQQKIVGLDVAMDPSLIVQVGQRRRSRYENVFGSMLKFFVTVRNELLLQVGNLEQLEQHERPVRCVAKVDRFDDVRVIKQYADCVLVLQFVNVGPRIFGPR